MRNSSICGDDEPGACMLQNTLMLPAGFHQHLDEGDVGSLCDLVLAFPAKPTGLLNDLFGILGRVKESDRVRDDLHCVSPGFLLFIL